MKEELIKEIREEIDKLEQRIFMLEMVDRWTEKDYKLSEELNNQLKELNNQLNEQLSYND